jgi:hypothetical protein
MELFSITWSTWGKGALDIRTYFGDVYIPARTIVLLVVSLVVTIAWRKIKYSKTSKDIVGVPFTSDEYPTDKPQWED